LNQLDRYRGCLLGLAAGDCVGSAVEFRPPGTFQPVTDMVGGGPFGLRPGEWTDDTSMALCLAESLIERQGFDPRDQMQRFCRWWRHGHLSSRGRCFDIGLTVKAALARFEKTGEPFAGSTDPRTAGNGSLMRLAPVPMAFAADPAEAVRLAGESSRTTHGAKEAVDACRYYAGLLVGALQGVAKDELLSDHFTPVAGLWQREPLAPKIATIAGGSFKRKSPPQIRGTGYIVDSMEAALWAFHTTDTYRDCVLKAAGLGDDADTTGAISGMLAGAFYGVGDIPAEWRAKLVMRDLIESFADKLHTFATTKGSN
jgi:ADP-ribosylglycohydrolase